MRAHALVLVRWFALVLLPSLTSTACTSLAPHDERAQRNLEAMSTRSVLDWSTAREVLLDCRDHTYHFDLDTRRLLFDTIPRDPPESILALIREVAKIPISDENENAQHSFDDAAAVSDALTWLTIHGYPEASVIARQRLTDDNVLVVVTALNTLHQLRYWSATSEVAELLRRRPQTVRSLMLHSDGLEFLAASPEAGAQVCGLTILDSSVRDYCSESIAGHKQYWCERFEEAAQGLERRFGCEPQAQRMGALEDGNQSAPR